MPHPGFLHRMKRSVFGLAQLWAWRLCSQVAGSTGRARVHSMPCLVSVARGRTFCVHYAYIISNSDHRILCRVRYLRPLDHHAVSGIARPRAPRPGRGPRPPAAPRPPRPRLEAPRPRPFRPRTPPRRPPSPACAGARALNSTASATSPASAQARAAWAYETASGAPRPRPPPPPYRDDGDEPAGAPSPWLCIASSISRASRQRPPAAHARRPAFHSGVSSVCTAGGSRRAVARRGVAAVSEAAEAVAVTSLARRMRRKRARPARHLPASTQVRTTLVHATTLG